jgi:hypothetical protein
VGWYYPCADLNARGEVGIVRLESNPDRSFTQRHDDEYHEFPATLGMFVDINVDFDTDPKNISIEEDN